MADNAASEGVKESEEVKQDTEGNPQTESAESAPPNEAEEEKKDENAPESGKCFYSDECIFKIKLPEIKFGKKLVHLTTKSRTSYGSLHRINPRKC